MDRIDVLRYTQRHAEQIRQSIPSPSKDTQMMWRLDDARREALIRLYEQQDTDDDYDISISVVN